MEPGSITPEEVPDFLRTIRDAFHRELPPADLERLQSVTEPERTLAIRDGGRIVAGTGLYSRRLTVPAGDVPVAGVTQVGVLSTHRRRGLLTRLMRRQLDDIRAAGREAVAALWASEPAIYQRFGYGLGAATADLSMLRHEVAWHAPPARDGLRDGPAPEALDAIRPIFDAARQERAGMVDRAGPWWEARLDDPPDERDGAQPLRAVVAGEDAYALYAVRPRFGAARPEGEVRIWEVIAATPAGHAAVWGFLLDLDLTYNIVWELAPPDEPLLHRLRNPRAVETHACDGLWVRLVDVPRALAERAYAAPFEVVLEVADEFCPWNAGRWALRWDGTAATCERTSLPAGLALGAADLGAAYLGGTTLDCLARAGRVAEQQGGALAAASRAFRGDREPWCPEIF